MRIAIIAVLGIASPSFADRVGGSTDGGGGRLGQVSSGLATATGGEGASSASSGAHSGGWGGYDCERYRIARMHDEAYRVTLLDRECRGFWNDPNTDHSVHAAGVATIEPSAVVVGFAGAQKVYQSDGSLTLALSVVDQRLRINGSFTQYYETEMNGAHISMMAPELTAGVRLGDDGPTRVWVESGVMYLNTHDPRGNSSLTGPSIGARLEQRMANGVEVVGTVEGAYLDSGVRAWAGRVGVRYHHVEAAFRVLDLNVGPALFGPELGVGF
jgi:hypothetical protein